MALIELLEAKVKDESGRLTFVDDFLPALEAALLLYSAHRPKELVVDAPGDGSHDVALPETWVAEFSRLLRVEYPAGEVPEVILSAQRYRLYQAPTGRVLRLLDETPAADESVRLAFTAPRTEEDIITGDTDAVACLGAAICCETLANLFASANDPTIAADVVNYRTKSAEWAARAKRLRQLYLDHMGIDDEGGAPASMTVAPPPDGGWSLTHGRRD